MRVRPTASIVLVLATLVAASGSLQAAPDRLEGRALIRAIEVQRIATVRFEEASLDAVVRWLRVATGRNLHVDHAALAKADVDVDALRFTATLADVTVANLMRLMFEPRGISVVARRNVLVLTSARASRGRPITRIYGIADLTWRKTDFVAPSMDLRPSGTLQIEEVEPEVPADDLLTGPDVVIELLKQLVEPAGWDANPDWAISGTQRYLVVRAPIDVHQQIPHALSRIAAIK